MHPGDAAARAEAAPARARAGPGVAASAGPPAVAFFSAKSSSRGGPKPPSVAVAVSFARRAAAAAVASRASSSRACRERGTRPWPAPRAVASDAEVASAARLRAPTLRISSALRVRRQSSARPDRVLASADASDARSSSEFSIAPARLDAVRAGRHPREAPRVVVANATWHRLEIVRGRARRGGSRLDGRVVGCSRAVPGRRGAAALDDQQRVFAQTLEDVTVGRLAVVGEDYPSAAAVEEPALRRVPRDLFPAEVATKSAPSGWSARSGGGLRRRRRRRERTLYVGALRGVPRAPVRVRPERVGLRTRLLSPDRERCSSPFRCRSSAAAVGSSIRRLRRRGIFENRLTKGSVTNVERHLRAHLRKWYAKPISRDAFASRHLPPLSWPDRYGASSPRRRPARCPPTVDPTYRAPAAAGCSAGASAARSAPSRLGRGVAPGRARRSRPT